MINAVTARSKFSSVILDFNMQAINKLTFEAEDACLHIAPFRTKYFYEQTLVQFEAVEALSNKKLARCSFSEDAA